MRLFARISPWIMFAVLAGCAMSEVDRARFVLSTAAQVGDSTQEMVASMDETRLGEIEYQIRKDGNIIRAERDKAEWNDKYKHMRQALKTYAAAIAAAKLTVELWAAGKKPDFGKVIADALEALRQLKGALGSYGVNVPTGGLF